MNILCWDCSQGNSLLPVDIEIPVESHHIQGQPHAETVAQVGNKNWITCKQMQNILKTPGSELFAHISWGEFSIYIFLN